MKKHDPRNCVVGVQLPDGKQLSFVEPVSVWRAISVGAKAGALRKLEHEAQVPHFKLWLLIAIILMVAISYAMGSISA